MERVHGSAVYRLMDRIKLGPSNLRWRAHIRSHEGVSWFLISVADFAMDGLRCSIATTAAWTEVHGGAVTGASELSLRSARHDSEWRKMMRQERSSSPRVQQSRGSGGSVSRRGALLLQAWRRRCLAPVGFHPRRGVGQHQEASAVLPVRLAVLERLQNGVAVARC
jgi:hypothetical protein